MALNAADEYKRLSLNSYEHARTRVGDDKVQSICRGLHEVAGA